MFTRASRLSPAASRSLYNCVCYYSRKSNPNNNDSPYKVVKSRVKYEDESGRLGSEGSLNWELFSAKGNRFFLPGSLGPAWVNNFTTMYADVLLDDLVDFGNKSQSDKLRLRSQECPQLLRPNLQEIFPVPEVATQSSPLALLELTYAKDTKCDEETVKGAKLFILAAREICTRLRLHGYWADFMNPFSGKPFHSYAGKSLYKQDQRFRGIFMRLESVNNCTLIAPEQEFSFSGNVFTNAPYHVDVIRNLIKD